jgi:hypothetical protein
MTITILFPDRGLYRREFNGTAMLGKPCPPEHCPALRGGGLLTASLCAAGPGAFQRPGNHDVELDSLLKINTVTV